MNKATAESIVLVALFFCLVAMQPNLSRAWENGPYTESGNVPGFGTHDWIPLHAANWLSANERWWIENNVDLFLLGTELPDNAGHPLGIGDNTLHHAYFSSPSV